MVEDENVETEETPEVEEDQKDNTTATEKFDSGFPEMDFSQGDGGLEGIPKMDMGSIEMNLNL